ncbi:MAG: PilZ domain-containing protein [Deltaproteobacteria bacterium]|nr:PilZ domain-containing protein [Deltaproteobacteria bacterium]MBI4795727.1 PilZ domain-containing protein [Deltaproteobacteria bacterium]
MTRERRRRTRVKFRFEALVAIDNQEVRVQSRNLSLKGMLCSTDKIFQDGQTCRVTLNLSRENEPEAVRAVILGRIIRTTPEETAIDFNLMDAESFFHLKRIVEYHAQEPERIARELLTAAFSPNLDG